MMGTVEEQKVVILHATIVLNPDQKVTTLNSGNLTRCHLDNFRWIAIREEDHQWGHCTAQHQEKEDQYVFNIAAASIAFTIFITCM